MIVSMALIDEPQHISLFEEIYNTYRSGMFRIANAVLHDHTGRKMRFRKPF